MSTWAALTREQKDERNRAFRHRYATDESFRALFRGYARTRMKDFQKRMEAKIRRMTLGHRGWYAPIYEPLMVSICGLSREEFTNRFFHGEETDHIVPLCRFDLTNPEHVVRSMHPSNLCCILKTQNLVKSDDCPNNLDIMSLQWVGTESALGSARALIEAVKVKTRAGRPRKT